MKIVTSGHIFRLFKEHDENTILRRTNIRTFAKQNNVKYHIVGQNWLIDFDSFMSTINPYKVTHRVNIPKVRTIASAFKEFNKTHNIKINNHMVERCLARNKNITYIKFHRLWLINYEELEQEIINQLNQKGIVVN